MVIRNAQNALNRFSVAATAQAAATATGSYKAGNKGVKELTKALKGLAANGSVHLLYPLLDLPDVGPRSWAAAYLLAHRGAVGAEKAPTKSAAENNIHSFGAEMTLKEWRAGRSLFSLQEPSGRSFAHPKRCCSFAKQFQAVF